MRSQNFQRTGWFFFVWVMALILGTTALAQKADGFRADLGDGVAAVKEAPCTLVLKAIDARETTLSSFDWTADSISLSGLSSPHGESLTGIPKRVLAPGEDKASSYSGTIGKSAFEISDGVLTLSNVVLTDEVEVSQGDTRFVVVDRTIPPWSAIIPPLVAILLAIVTRQVLIALFVGIWVGMWSILGGPIDGFYAAITESLPQALTESRVKILIFSCLLGSVVAMVARMGGLSGFGRSDDPARQDTARCPVHNMVRRHFCVL